MAGNRIIFVKILEIKHTYLFWEPRMYVCNVCDAEGHLTNHDPFNVREKFLSEYYGKVVIRYPDDVPIINRQEVETFRKLYTDYSGNLSIEEQVRLAKLILKLDLFANVIHEY